MAPPRTLPLWAFGWAFAALGALACSSSSSRDMYFGTDAGAGYEAPIREVQPDAGGANDVDGGQGQQGGQGGGGGQGGQSGQGGSAGEGGQAGSAPTTDAASDASDN